MPWKESSVMDERLRFLARVLDGEPMTDVCRDFGISRKTGYKIFDRYKEHGLEALSDRSRRPVRLANQLPAQLEARIVAIKREKPHWGARKIRELLVRRLPSDIRVPAKSTIHAVLHRHGLVAPPGRPRRRATGTPLSRGSTPNELWCTDFKGEFKLGNGRYCYPLTVTDHASRYLLLCEALESTREHLAITAFERLFRERGLPEAIRSDNGVPFASPNALFNLSKLAVWWLRLGIDIERIKPGRPQQNGRHERMHLTLKKETVRPPGANSLQQQARFDEFVREFNTERPHEALRPTDRAGGGPVSTLAVRVEWQAAHERRDADRQRACVGTRHRLSVVFLTLQLAHTDESRQRTIVSAGRRSSRPRLNVAQSTLLTHLRHRA